QGLFYPSKSPFWIIGTVVNFTQLRPEAGPCTHYTRLESDIKLTLVEILGPQAIGGSGDGEDFGMCSDISQFFCLIIGSCNDFIPAYYYCAYRNFSFLKRQLRLLIGLVHKILVTIQFHRDFFFRLSA